MSLPKKSRSNYSTDYSTPATQNTLTAYATVHCVTIINYELEAGTCNGFDLKQIFSILKIKKHLVGIYDKNLLNTARYADCIKVSPVAVTRK